MSGNGIRSNFISLLVDSSPVSVPVSPTPPVVVSPGSLVGPAVDDVDIGPAVVGSTLVDAAALADPDESSPAVDSASVPPGVAGVVIGSVVIAGVSPAEPSSAPSSPHPTNNGPTSKNRVQFILDPYHADPSAA